IFYINSSDGGLTWSEDFNLTAMNLDADYPHITVNGDNVHVIYCEDRDGIWQIHYRRSENNGLTWTDDVKLSYSTDDVYLSAIALRDNEVHVVWTDERDGNREIYYKYSLDNGENWSEDIRLTHDPAQSITQDIAVNNDVHVVFSDDRSGDMEIYYKYYPVPSSPTNLTIEIQGTILTVNWTAPQNSPSPVDHYLIYRSTTWNGFDFSSPWIDTSVNFDPIDSMNIPLRTSWNDTTAFLDEGNNYYYIVRAIDAEGWNDTNRNIVGKFVIPLNMDWNLISLPLAQNDTKISEVLKSIDGSYDMIQWYDAKDGIWRTSPSSLTDINRTMGIWIHMKNKCNLSVVGAVPESTDIALYEGWNLVGYPSLKTRNLNDALSGIYWYAMQHFDAFDINDHWKHNCTAKPEWMNDLKEMRPGGGYWVFVTINETWARTRTVEDGKVVIWRVHGLDQMECDRLSYESMFEDPIERWEEDDYKVNIVPDQPTDKDKKDNFAISLFPLIILITFIFGEIVLIHKKVIK
ncbi:MAG: exo-alpha-sialidase, partial [Methanomassiliicoccales archaeon]